MLEFVRTGNPVLPGNAPGPVHLWSRKQVLNFYHTGQAAVVQPHVASNCSRTEITPLQTAAMHHLSSEVAPADSWLGQPGTGKTGNLAVVRTTTNQVQAELQSSGPCRFRLVCRARVRRTGVGQSMIRAAAQPQPEAVQIYINHRCGKQRQHLAYDQSAHNRDA